MITILKESNNNNTIAYNLDGDVYQLGLYVDEYEDNGNLYIGLVDVEDGELFADISVNVGSLDKDCICLSGDFETENERIIKQYKLGTPTGDSLKGYKVYKMNMANVKKYQVD